MSDAKTGTPARPMNPLAILALAVVLPGSGAALNRTSWT